MQRSAGKEEESTERHKSEGEDLDRATGGAKRARASPTFTDDQEMFIIEFVKEHLELFAKENARYVDKARKYALWYQIGQEIGRSGPEIHRRFNSQLTRCGKLASIIRNFFQPLLALWCGGRLDALA